MTLPAAPPMTMAQMVAEFGIALPAVFPRDFYGKGGAPAAGALSFADFLGRSAVTFDHAPGPYTVESADFAQFRITCSQAAVWTWTRSSTPRNSGIPATGGSSTTWTGTCNSINPPLNAPDQTTQPNSVEFTVNATIGGVTYGPWTVDLICDGGGA